MTTPINNVTTREQSTTNFTFRAGADVTAIYNSNISDMTIAGAMLGTKVEHKGWHADIQGTVGTGLQGKLEVGHTFDVSKVFGLDLSAKAQYTKDLNKHTRTHYVTLDMPDLTAVNDKTSEVVSFPEAKYQHTETKDFNPEVYELGGKLSLVHKGKKGEIKFGVESGYRKCSPDLNYNFNQTVEQKVVSSTGQEYNRIANVNVTEVYKAPEGLYITPFVEGNINIGKKGLYVGGAANANQATVNVGFKF